ncbi:hypothetical protein FLP10_08805 [Agromyces intestinalis]|uniref:Uncharacterized protein n=1 Tax=Agromyces intestinalis TaxID=2592652 RepID=A0A5C1YEN3_9MICO|nr:hypothetical protein [Agromyces intestinalis]QEO14504.1 hypothetical protein FLP10_08805 [Agromyces intestinalis]
MNTLTTALGSTSNHGAMRYRARRLHERLAARVGLALLSWSRPTDTAPTHDEVALRRRVELEAAQLRNGTYADLALRSKAA